MAQILIIQDSGEVGLALDQHAIVRANGTDDVRRAVQAGNYQAAVVVQRADTDAVLELLRAADSDLAAVLVATKEQAGRQPAATGCEVLTIPFLPEILRHAVDRAIRRTELEREVKSLRAQLKGGAGAGPEATDGNGSGPHLAWIRTLPSRFDLRELLSSVEKTIILRTLEATKGAQAEAARRLGLSRSDLSYKLAKYELRKPASVRAGDPSQG